MGAVLLILMLGLFIGLLFLWVVAAVLLGTTVFAKIGESMCDGLENGSPQSAVSLGGARLSSPLAGPR